MALINKQFLGTVLLAAAGFAAGIALFYHGFELVSIPDIREYHETLWVLGGLLMMAASIGFGFFKIKSRIESNRTAS